MVDRPNMTSVVLGGFRMTLAKLLCSENLVFRLIFLLTFILRALYFCIYNAGYLCDALAAIWVAPVAQFLCSVKKFQLAKISKKKIKLEMDG